MNMGDREILMPETKEDWLKLRAQDITSTEVSALFGASPYMTLFELWHRKKNAEVVTLDENERMKWGTRLQKAIAEGIAADHGWKVSPMDEYMRMPKLRMGSSFDFNLLIPELGQDGLLEIKNVDALVFKEGWAETDGGLEAPPHIEFQVQHQLAVSGRPYARIGALVGGNRVVIIERKAEPAIIEAIYEKVRNFWASIEKGDAPVPDFSRDSETIARLYGYAEPGKVLNLMDDRTCLCGCVLDGHTMTGCTVHPSCTGFSGRDERISDLMEKYVKERDAESEAETRKKAIKAEVLTLIGDAEKVSHSWFSIDAGIRGEVIVPEYTRKAYRNFMPRFKKKKEASE